MNLFAPDATTNLLPCDGTVHYFGRILGPAEARTYLDVLLRQVPWKHDETVMFGKRIVTARKVAWFGDATFSYAYSGTTKQALPWTTELLALKALVEQRAGATFNSCLLNLYEDGSQGMGWHSDDEKCLERHAAIASVSLGAERKFGLQHKQLPHTLSILLEHGSLLVMKDATQTHWRHSLPKSKKVTTARINLTFRTMVMRSE